MRSAVLAAPGKITVAERPRPVAGDGEVIVKIAATAVWLDYRVATRDLRSFPRIQGLDIVRC